MLKNKNKKGQDAAVGGCARASVTLGFLNVIPIYNYVLFDANSLVV
jgi:hypothetical protein